jgi:hypothetical protein
VPIGFDSLKDGVWEVLLEPGMGAIIVISRLVEMVLGVRVMILRCRIGDILEGAAGRLEMLVFCGCPSTLGFWYGYGAFLIHSHYKSSTMNGIEFEVKFLSILLLSI